MKRAVLAIAIAACSGHSHDEGKRGHDHAESDEPRAESVTMWGQRAELFLEYQPLVVGNEAKFATHLTEMPSFKPVTEGTATVTIKYANGTNEVATARAPSAPGVFRPTLTPKQAGACQVIVSITGPQATETFPAAACQVFASADDARKAAAKQEQPAGRITFLKEQQWKTDFALVVVGKRDLQDGVRANGEIRPVAGREARIAAPVAGRVELASPTPLLGTPVKQGTLLGTIAPRASGGADRASLASEVDALKAEVAAARAELARAQRLVADQAAPAKTVEEARTRVQVAEARLGGASGRLGQLDATAAGGGGGRRYQLRAPIDGVLVAIDAATGETVEEGKPLFDVIELARVWLVAQVFEPDVPRVEHARTAWFTIDGYAEPFTVDESKGKLVTIGRVIDPKTRTVPVIFEVDNSDGRLRIGNFTKVVIATGEPRNVLAIPESAIVDDSGKPVAYAMVGGEAFERRPLRLGIRSNGWAEVLEGLGPGEHVVSKGAYEIRLSAASGAVPAHGHVH